MFRRGYSRWWVGSTGCYIPWVATRAGVETRGLHRETRAPGSGWAECRMGVLPRARINDKLREETRTDRVMRSLAAWAASKLGRGD